jgi:hypothetical protein
VRKGMTYRVRRLAEGRGDEAGGGCFLVVTDVGNDEGSSEARVKPGSRYDLYRNVALSLQSM